MISLAVALASYFIPQHDKNNRVMSILQKRLITPKRVIKSHKIRNHKHVYDVKEKKITYVKFQYPQDTSGF